MHGHSGTGLPPSAETAAFEEKKSTEKADRHKTPEPMKEAL